MTTRASDVNEAIPAVEPVATRDEKRRRLESLDLLRGLTVVGMIIVNASAALDAAGQKVFPVLLHAHWAGLNAADVVFPAFITMVGVSIAVSSKPGGAVPTGRILWRSLRLFLLGLALVNMYLLLVPAGMITPRIPGVLQRIAIAYGVVALAYPRTSTRVRAITAAAILIGYWVICLLPLPDGTPVDLWAQGRNFPSWVDRQVFGNWVNVKGPDGFDPEGLLSTLPVIAQALLGTLAGDALRKGLPIGEVSRKLALAGIASIVVSLVWNLVFPIAKNIWTSSFVLLTVGMTMLGLAFFHWLRDGRDGAPVKGRLLGSFGRNAIFAYAVHIVFIGLVMSAAFRSTISPVAPYVGVEWAALVPVLIFLAVMWVPVAILDRLGWYLKI